MSMRDLTRRSKKVIQMSKMAELAAEQQQSTELIKYHDGIDPFAAYASAMGGTGKLLKFSKGDFTAGESNEEVPPGTKFIANVEDLQIGWNRWEDGKPAEHVLGRLADSFSPPRREALGHTDQTQWKTGTDGNAIDPWQFVNYLPLVRLDDLEQHTFTTSSRGGLNAIGKLCGQFHRLRWKHRGHLPVIALEVGAYQHADYGKIKFPVLKIVDWQPEGGEGAPLPDAPSTGAELNDEIPF
jgi:hypothetical protein